MEETIVDGSPTSTPSSKVQVLLGVCNPDAGVVSAVAISADKIVIFGPRCICARLEQSTMGLVAAASSGSNNRPSIPAINMMLLGMTCMWWQNTVCKGKVHTYSLYRGDIIKKTLHSLFHHHCKYPNNPKKSIFGSPFHRAARSVGIKSDPVGCKNQRTPLLY